MPDWSRNLDKNAFTAEKLSVKQGLPVRKKSLLTIAFISTLLFSTVAETQFVHLGKANPYAIITKEEQGRGEASPPEGVLPPEILILSPENNTEYSSNTISLTFNVSEQWLLFVQEMYYRTSWQSSRKTPIKVVRLESPRWVLSQISINVTDIPEGPRWLEVYAVGKGGIKTREEYRYPFLTEYYMTYQVVGSSMVNFTIDTTPPIISALSVENKTYHTPNVPLNAFVNEQVSQVSYSLDGHNNATVVGNTTLTNLPFGEHCITVYATDRAGNTGAAETAYFTTEEPFPTTLLISVATVAVIIASLLVYFKKRKH